MRNSGPNAPSRPRSAFNLYMQYRLSHDEDLVARPFIERRRLIGGEWSAMSQQQKQIYRDQAICEREKYLKEFDEYKKTDEYKEWIAKQEISQSLKRGKKTTGKHNVEDGLGDGVSSKFRRVPIFTQEFLEYNRQREMSLRHLRKQVTKLDEETALLSKHVENLANAGNNLEQQIKAAEAQLSLEEAVVQKFCKELVTTFADLPVPTLDKSTRSPSKGSERITLSSVDSYLSRLAELSSSGNHETLRTTAVEFLRAAIRSKKLTMCST
uniref:HMG box domain-containing protein n=1 Tax=Mesocestoides corti TaxID=53468 RepID=A0A5K3ESG5_MESCO